jgi:hypothetical protein
VETWGQPLKLVNLRFLSTSPHVELPLNFALRETARLPRECYPAAHAGKETLLCPRRIKVASDNSEARWGEGAMSETDVLRQRGALPAIHLADDGDHIVTSDPENIELLVVALGRRSRNWGQVCKVESLRR